MRGFRRGAAPSEAGKGKRYRATAAASQRWLRRLDLVGEALDGMDISLRDVLIVLDGEAETDGTLVSMLCARLGTYVDVWKLITFSSMDHNAGSLVEAFLTLADQPPAKGREHSEEVGVVRVNVEGDAEGPEAEDAELLASTQLGRPHGDREPIWAARYRGVGTLLDQLGLQIRSATLIDLGAGVFVNLIVQGDEVTPGWHLRSFSFANRQIESVSR